MSAEFSYKYAQKEGIDKPGNLCYTIFTGESGGKGFPFVMASFYHELLIHCIPPDVCHQIACKRNAQTFPAARAYPFEVASFYFF